MARKSWGKRSMKEFMGNNYNPEDKFVTYEEMTQKWNSTSGEKAISRNTMCNWYHKAMIKLATHILKSQGIDLPPDKIKRISRSIEFQSFVRELMENTPIRSEDF